MIKENPAIVLGLFETGLGVARSLGGEGINVIGLDYYKDIGFYSRFIDARICPHPKEKESDFINFLIDIGKSCENKIVLFISSDEFLLPISKNVKKLDEHFLINLSPSTLLESISNKFEQYKMANEAGTAVPQTILIECEKDINEAITTLPFPIIVKGMNATEWRIVFGGTKKGFVYNNSNGLKNDAAELISKNIRMIAQELIEGPDSNHYKFCGYVDKDGKLRAGFCLKKIRQNPIHYGIGCLVESIINDELMEAGKKFFKSINYKGIGSAEFKLDEKDGKFKLIELNPRYWQQNSLASVCGVNFPLIQYRDLTGQQIEDTFVYSEGIKWVNIYSDFDSFLSYRKEGVLSFKNWLKSLKGKKVFSDWAKDDILPGFYEIRFGKKLFNLPIYLWKKLIRK